MLGDQVPLGPEQNLHLLRSAQEAPANAAKDAPGRPVTVALEYTDQAVTLTMSNLLRSDRTTGSSGGERSPGFETVDGGYRLTCIHERLLLIGGHRGCSERASGRPWRFAAA
ncbi:hypothetical protein ABTZ03_42690 [Kitasatospora sp. NPDC096077]|uniref:hypothetical protein n=1 Tax=Kitasatospora sp. NPDC096077 TaxID=3155544 RepID=UPI00331ABC16